MSLITPHTVADIAPVVMRYALEHGGVSTADLYDYKHPAYRKVYDRVYASSESGRRSRRVVSELEYYEGEGDLYFHIETTTDFLRENGWIVYENVTPSEVGDQYVIKVTDDGRKNLRNAAKPTSYRVIESE